MLERGPASTVSMPEKHSGIMSPSATEVYSFERKVKATVNEKTIADTQYSGFFIVNWVSETASEKTGRFSFILKDAEASQIFLEAKMTPDYKIISLLEPKVQNAEEEDLLSFTKDLVSIYAFQSLSDTTGRYQARIYETSKGNWLKKKLKYEDPKFASLSFNKSIHQIKMVKTEIQELSGVEETALANNENAGFKTHATYLLRRTSTKGLTKSKLTAGLMKNVKLEPALLTVVPIFVAQEKINWADTYAQLDLKTALTGNERLQWFHEVTKSLKANPSKIGEFIAWARSNLQNGKTANFAVGVLATLGTPEAQKELVGIYNQSASHPELKPLCHVILNAFATASVVSTPETKEFLSSQMRSNGNSDLAINAAFAMGATLQKEPSPVYEQQLSETAAQAKTMNEKLAYIDAMGNSGSSQFLPQISENMSSADSAVKEKSIFALRYMSDERATTLLQGAMNDPALSVKITAVKAISYQRDITPFRNSLAQCAQSSEVRLKEICTQTLSN